MSVVPQGADASRTNDLCQTALYLAAEHQKPAAVQLLCKACPSSVNTANEWGLTPLHIAARSGDTDTIETLLLYQVSNNRAGFFSVFCKYMVTTV